jgi:hypothetical protein
VSANSATSASSAYQKVSSDIYYLAFPDDPPQRKVLVYGVYTAELIQVILLAKMAYTEFAAGFGKFGAINDIGLLWFAVPTLSSLGMYHPFFGRYRSRSYK